MRRRTAILLLLAASAAAIWQWQRTWFLCDDAFIAFRYAANAHAGHGLTWNAPPFLPVEGYSCFLWVMLLLGTWELTGFEPPQTANAWSLVFGLLSLALCAAAIVRASARTGRAQPWLLALGLFGIVANRTFATWLGSGLETAMFGTFAIAWTLTACRPGAATTVAATLPMATSAALAALTRPDGALLVIATLGLVGGRVVAQRRFRLLAGLLPLLAPLLHLWWRRCYYGEWLPNTWFAKVIGAWPEAGGRYLGCFVLEHGVWLFAPLLAFAAWRAVVAAVRPGHPAFGSGIAFATWSGFVGYYALVVGGDHFEYRPFAHLVPLLFVAAVAALARTPVWLSIGAMLGLGIAANGFGWLLDRHLPAANDQSFVATADHAPAWLRPVFRWHDANYGWLRLHFVGLRRELHAGFSRHLIAGLPPRSAGIPADPNDRPVLVVVNAGVAGWTQPHAAVLDLCGLSDWVIARSPVPPPPESLPTALLGEVFTALDRDRNNRLHDDELTAALARLQLQAMALGTEAGALATLLRAVFDPGDDGLDQAEFAAAAQMLRWTRRMAHERGPPVGYVDAFRPDLVVDGGTLSRHARQRPLTAADILAAENAFRAAVRAGALR